jgi:hypothetical protein
MTLPKSRIPATALVLAVTIGGGLLDTGRAHSAGRSALKGTLRFAAGALTHSHGAAVYTGTYFRMLYPGGKSSYFKNSSSTAKDQTYTLLRPGTEGGLELGSYQPPPKTAFTSSGSALARAITLPEGFASIKFSISTASKDAQTGKAVAAPTLYLSGGKLTGDLSAWTAEWNKIYFNQGSPKPGGTYPGSTTPVTGTYDAKTKAFVITWYSLIVGGPFNGFTGFWHLQGKLRSGS